MDPSDPLDLAAFNAPLWVDPPRPVIAKADAPAPLPPLRLQLVAILNAPAPSGTVAAAPLAILYDQDADKLVTVATGDVVGGRTITAVDPGGVTVQLGGGPQRLDLFAKGQPSRSPRPPHLPSASAGHDGATAAEELAALMGRPVPSPTRPTAPLRPTEGVAR